MYKNQLQELAQRSCFNLPSYTCIREGPDHAPRFKVVVNFNGELFESPNFCTTLRQAEHSAAEVALRSLSSRAPSHSLAAKILDETGVYKNLLQEISQRVGARLPSYTTFRSGLGHLPVFTCTVELAGITFTGEPAKNKKQAEKNAAMAAWSSLKKLAKQETSSSSDTIESNDEQEQITIARALLKYRLKEKMTMLNNPNASPFPKKFPLQPDKKTSSMQSSSYAGSKILPLIHTQLAPKIRSPSPVPHNERALALATSLSSSLQNADSCANSMRPSKFPATGATPYVPVHQYRSPSPFSCSVAPPVTMRTVVPVFSAPPASNRQFQPFSPPVHIAPPVQIRQTVPAFAAVPKPTAPPPVRIQGKQPGFIAAVKQEQLLTTTLLPTGASSAVADPRTGIKTSWAVDASKQPFPPSSAPLPSASSALIETDREHGQNALVEDDDLLQQSDIIHSLERLLI